MIVALLYIHFGHQKSFMYVHQLVAKAHIVALYNKCNYKVGQCSTVMEYPIAVNNK